MYTAAEARTDVLLSKMDADRKVKVMTLVKEYEEKIKSAAENGLRELKISKDEFESKFGNDKGLIFDVLYVISYRGFECFEPSPASIDYEIYWY